LENQTGDLKIEAFVQCEYFARGEWRMECRFGREFEFKSRQCVPLFRCQFDRWNFRSVDSLGRGGIMRAGTVCA